MPLKVVTILFALALCLRGEIASQQLISADPALRQAIFGQLAAMPESERLHYLPELVALLRGENAYRILPAFAKIGPSAIPALLKLLNEPSRNVRGFSAEAIAMISPVAPDIISRLRLMLKDKDEWVRGRVAASLLSVGMPDDAAQSIVRESWKPFQIEGSCTKTSRAVSALIQSFSSNDPTVVADAICLLRNGGQSAVPDLIAALRNENPRIRIGAADALMQIDVQINAYQPDIESASIRALQDPTARVRELARFVLIRRVSIAARDALLEDEIVEMRHAQTAGQEAEKAKARPRSLAEILAPVPPDPDNSAALKLVDQFETKAPDGTVLYTVLHQGEGRSDLLRIWRHCEGGYELVKEAQGTGTDSHVTANVFRYGGKAYIHIMNRYAGTAAEHEDEFFRIEAGGISRLATPKGLPLALGIGEGSWKGISQEFFDDELEFQFGIWREGDANCCPSAGWVTGTYTIVGDELRYESWSRSNAFPR